MRRDGIVNIVIVFSQTKRGFKWGYWLIFVPSTPDTFSDGVIFGGERRDVVTPVFVFENTNFRLDKSGKSVIFIFDLSCSKSAP